MHFFAPKDIFKVGERVILEGAEFHHICGVVRVAKGEMITLINGQGSMAIGQIEAIEHHRCLIRILSCKQIDKPKAKVFLGLSFLRSNHLDFAIEKGTEVGVDSFVLFQADKAEKKLVSPSMIRRLDAMIVAATKQSGRSFFPEVHMTSSLQEALCFLPKPRLWADLRKDALHVSQALEAIPKPTSVSLLIGPESGWSPVERRLLSDEGTPVLLHSNTLRAETAALVAAYTVSMVLEARS